MSDKVEIPDEAVVSDLRAALKDLLSYCAKYVDDPDASEDEQIAYDDVHIRLAQLLGQHPASGGPERDYEPGTRFVVGGRMNDTYIIAQSMEPEIGSEVDLEDFTKIKTWKADPQVHYKVCSTPTVAKAYLDERNAKNSEVTSVSPWRVGSIGQAMPGYERVGMTGVKSLVRDVTYVNAYGEHRHWQSVGLDFVVTEEDEK